MATRTQEMRPEKDPRLDGGEWLFRRGGQVFGPLDSRAVAAMLYRGEIDGETQISSGDGAWRSLSSIPIFVVHAKKAEAALRVEREVTGERMLRARRNRHRAIAAVATALVLVAGAVAGALFLARRPDDSSRLLEDFGAGIRIASAARVGVGRRSTSAEDEIEVQIGEPGGERRNGRERRPSSAPAPGSAAEDNLVETQFDGRKIQAVVGRQQRTLAPCFREEAARSPEFQGDVPIEFAIGNDGRVATLWIDEPAFREGPLRECLVRALAGWRFDPFPGQRPTVSLAFRIGK